MPGFDREHGAFFLHAKNLQAGADTVTDGMITDPVSAPPSTVWCSVSISVIFHNRHCGCHGLLSVGAGFSDRPFPGTHDGTLAAVSYQEQVL